MIFKFWPYILIAILMVVLGGAIWYGMDRIETLTTEKATLSANYDSMKKSFDDSEAARKVEQDSAKETAAEIARQRDRAISDADNLKAYAEKLAKIAKERPQDAGNMPKLFLDSARGNLK